jgi:hypothetical protein
VSTAASWGEINRVTCVSAANTIPSGQPLIYVKFTDGLALDLRTAEYNLFRAKIENLGEPIVQKISQLC